MKYQVIPKFVALPVLAISSLTVAPSLYAQSSPFAGDGIDPAASSAINWSAPVYENTNVAVSSGAVPTGARSVGRGATGLNQSLARELGSLLPENISPVTQNADASYLSIGVSAPTPTAAIPDTNIDIEQSVELKEQVDPEQSRAIGASGAAGTVGKFIVHYPVAFKNIPVSKFADITAFVNESGRMNVLRKRNLPTSLDSESPTVTRTDALATAAIDAGDWAANAEVSGPSLEVWVGADGAGELSYRIELTDNQSSMPRARRYWVSATADSEVIYWESMIRHTHHGQVTGTVWTEAGTSTGSTASQELGDLVVNRSPSGAVTTEADGRFAFTSGGGATNLTSTLSGPHSRIQTMVGSVMARSRAATPASPADLTYNATGAAQLAQTTAFYWTNQGFELASDILNPTDLPNLLTVVNRPGQCNAYWNGSSINFYQAGGSCPNMAYDSVVLHEYGHGIDARKGGILNSGYSEGFGDAVSILGTRDSCVGQDFFGAGTCLRDAKDLVMWPLGGDGVHAQGRRYAGFVWELVQQLKSTYSEGPAYSVARQLVMGTAKANPSDIPDAVKLSFIVDDDDGNLANGTPHFKELAAAADSRNLPRPADPTQSVRRMGFAWANNPTSASYSPSATYGFNSANMPITASRSGTGRYAMTFRGLGGHGRAGANVQVTAYGASSNHCKVQSWSSGGVDFRANVRCFNSSGALVNDRYTVLINWP